MPSPIPLLQTSDGLCCSLDDAQAKYPSLFVNLALDKCVLPARAMKKFPRGIPYDFACPSVRNVLSQRICEQCGIYFASVKSLKLHGKCTSAKNNTSHNFANISSGRCVHPQRLAAKRPREMMCLVKYMEMEEFEWHDEEDIDSNGLEMPREAATETGTHIMLVENRNPVWQEDS